MHFISRAVLAFSIVSLSLIQVHANNNKPGPEYYQLRVYQFASVEQEKILDDYLSKAYLPGLHKAGIKQIGVFKPVTNDTAAIKKLYIFMAASSLDKLTGLPAKLAKDAFYTEAAKEYMEAAYNKVPFTRMENILLKSFSKAPEMKLPKLKADKKDRIYELRSYEGGTERLYNQKVKMFNEGGEVSIFERLNFNAIFYAEVLSGSRMPNLMYMTSFENREDRDTHWKAFNADAEWKQLSGLAEYQRTVSKADIILMRATEYSDF